MDRIEVITGVERRRRYSDAEQPAILAKCDEPDATIVGITKLMGISPSLGPTCPKRTLTEVAGQFANGEIGSVQGKTKMQMTTSPYFVDAYT